jgi:CheY-like chemotaxis protein
LAPAVLSEENVDFGERSMNQGSTSSAAAEPMARIATILIAEDHLDSRDAMRALLEAFGYRVLLAANGREAVSIATAQKPDLILMDIMMPRLDGLSATRLLREESVMAQTPILALTAMDNAREPALAAGCDDYLRKPIDVPRFFETVHRWIRDGRVVSS